MLISRKVTEVSEISHVNLRAGWKELTKPINRSNSPPRFCLAKLKPPKTFCPVTVLTEGCLFLNELLLNLFLEFVNYVDN